MSELISRQAVLNTLDNMDKALDEERTVEKYKELLTECIKVLPSAENKGTWRHYEGMLYCPKCGAEFYDEIMEYTGDEVPKHCPDCGADMRGEANV